MRSATSATKEAIKMTDENQTLEQTLDQTLNKTDFGTIINDNKKPIILGGVILLIAIVAFSIYSNQSEKSYQNELAAAYTFERDVLNQYTEGKIKTDEFLTKYKDIPSDILGSTSIMPAIFASADKLIKDKKKEDAIKILESWKEKLSKGSFSSYFMGLKLAPLYEDSQSYDKAISVLENLIASQIKISKARIYLDLGRVYSKKGDKVKANENFNFILENYKDTESAKVAKLYISK